MEPHPKKRDIEHNMLHDHIYFFMMCLHSRISSDLDDHPLIIQIQSLRLLRAPDTATKAPPMRPCQTCLFKKLFQQNVHEKKIAIWIWPLFHCFLWRSWGRWLSYAGNVWNVIRQISLWQVDSSSHILQIFKDSSSGAMSHQSSSLAPWLSHITIRS